MASITCVSRQRRKRAGGRWRSNTKALSITTATAATHKQDEGLLKTFQHNPALPLRSTAKLTKKVTKDIMISTLSITSLFLINNSPMSNSATSAGSGHQRWCPSTQLSFAWRDWSCACRLSLAHQTPLSVMHCTFISCCSAATDVYQCIQIVHYATNSSK